MHHAFAAHTFNSLPVPLTGDCFAEYTKIEWYANQLMWYVDVTLEKHEPNSYSAFDVFLRMYGTPVDRRDI